MGRARAAAPDGGAPSPRLGMAAPRRYAAPPPCSWSASILSSGGSARVRLGGSDLQVALQRPALRFVGGQNGEVDGRGWSTRRRQATSWLLFASILTIALFEPRAHRSAPSEAQAPWDPQAQLHHPAPRSVHRISSALIPLMACSALQSRSAHRF